MTETRGVGYDHLEQQVLAAVPALVYRATDETAAWSFTSVQGGLLEPLGTSAEELCDDPSRWVLMVHRADRERVIAERCRAARSGRLELEYRLQSADGTEWWVRDVAVVGELGDGIYGLITDLTEHRQADDVLEQLHDGRLNAVSALLHAASLRDTTVQLFVHDIRSPLTAVAGLAQTMKERGDALSAEDRDRIFDRIAAASHRVIALVDDFASVWGPPLGTAEPAQRALVADIVGAALAEVGLEDGVVDVDVRDVVVETHPELLRRVIVGLVRNAVQHNPGETRIRVVAAEADDHVVVDVEDDGPGIPEAFRNRMFEPHVRASQDANGMGMGLTLVRAGVSLLGGEVRALAHPSGGTIMRVELPRTSPSGEITITLP